METLVYLAGNMNTKTDFRTEFIELTPDHIRGLDPFERNVEFTSDNAVGRDIMLIQAADYTICDCRMGGNMTTGAAMEALIAKQLGKKVIALSKEKAPYFPDEGMHPFTWKFCDVCVDSVQEALDWIEEDLIDPHPSRNLEEQIKAFGWTSFPEGDINTIEGGK